MKKERMNISYSRFIIFKLKIFGKIVTTNFKLPVMAWDEFFIMYERFESNFWKFYKKVPHQPLFLTPLAQNFGVFWFVVHDSDNLQA